MGGIRTHGDILQSIRFSATMVMIGSLFAGHEESPGKTVEVNGMLYKEYFGSASEFQKVNVRTLKVRKSSFLIKDRCKIRLLKCYKTYNHQSLGW